MTASAPKEVSKEALSALNLLSSINKLTLKVFGTKKRQALIFLILNDTYQIMRYNRAVLWSFNGKEVHLLGVSGQSTLNTTSEIAKQWKHLISHLKTPNEIHLLNSEAFQNEQESWKKYEQLTFKPSVLWMPIVSNGKQSLGLWLERWEGESWNKQDAEILNFLIQAYGIAWEKFTHQFSFRSYRSKIAWSVGLTIFLLTFLIHIPLRIVAPCEVIPKNPYLVTAPLEDIIDQITIKPGQEVTPGAILFEYDKRVALQSLKIAEDQVAVAEQDLIRAKTLAFKDEKALNDVNVLTAKLKKEQANLALAKYRASQLVYHSPEAGIAMFEDPDQWRGKPVKVGEKILMIIKPKLTRIRLWIPEDDNIKLNFNDPIKVFLNVSPTLTREAKLTFVSNATSIFDRHLVSFMAEAEWIEPQNDIKVGLKGTAILYGEKVTLFYWIMRKPWIYFRNFLGI